MDKRHPSALWWLSAEEHCGTTAEEGKSECWDVLAIEGHHQDPFFFFLPRGLGLLPDLGCCHCRCLDLSTCLSLPLPLDLLLLLE